MSDRFSKRPLSDLTRSSTMNRPDINNNNNTTTNGTSSTLFKKPKPNMRQSLSGRLNGGTPQPNRRQSGVFSSSSVVRSDDQFKLLQKIEEDRNAEKRAIDEGKVLLKSEIALLNSELYKIRTELPEIQLDLEKQATKFSQFKNQYNLQCEKLKELDVSLSTRLMDFKIDKEVVLTELKNKYLSRTNELQKRFENDIDQIEFEKAERLRKEENRLEDELESLKNNYQSLESQLNEDIRLVQQEIRQAFDLVKADLEKSKVEILDTIAATENDIDRLKNENPELEKELQMTSEGLQKIETEFESQKEKSDIFEEHTKVIRSEITELEEKIHEHVNQIQKSLNDSKRFEKDTIFFNQQFLQEQILRRKIHNQLQDLKGNMRVFCRARPCLRGEKSLDLQTVLPNTSIALDQTKEYLQLRVPTTKTSTSSYYSNTAPPGFQVFKFGFDKVFDQYTSNSEIFEEISQLVQSALDGFNVCIFAYGQTGSGKTYTMTAPEDGMIPRSVYQIFQEAENLKEQGWDFQVSGQFLEIYNENINDLMTDAYARNLDKKSYDIIHDDETQTTVVNDLTSVQLESPEVVSKILERAMRNRMTASTKSNERSSRSHSVFLLTIEGMNYKSGERTVGRLNLIDLAGSERVKSSQVTGSRLRETQAINKSLSALSDVILILNERKKGSHIPFRNSKLTHLLKYSLGGSSKTLMFVNISSNAEHSNETLNSLRFAEKVNDTKMNHLSGAGSKPPSRKSLPSSR